MGSTRPFSSERGCRRVVVLAIVSTTDAPDAIDVAANFAEYFSGFHKANLKILTTLQWWLTAACVLLGLQVVAWALAVL